MWSTEYHAMKLLTFLVVGFSSGAESGPEEVVSDGLSFFFEGLKQRKSHVYVTVIKTDVYRNVQTQRSVAILLQSLT